MDGTGRQMTENELFNSVRLHCNAVKGSTDYDELAKEVNFDVELEAQKIFAISDRCQLQISITEECETILMNKINDDVLE